MNRTRFQITASRLNALLPKLGAGSLLLLANFGQLSCASNKDLASDKPFNQADYRAKSDGDAKANSVSDLVEKAPDTKQEPAKNKPNFRFDVTCTNAAGQNLKEGDVGYEACLQEKRKP